MITYYSSDDGAVDNERSNAHNALDKPWKRTAFATHTVCGVELRVDINKCGTISDFLSLYDMLDAVARRIRVAIGCRSPDEYAADWAIAFRLKGDKGELDRVNEDRKTILVFVYRLVDCIWDSRCSDVTIQSVEKDFKAHRLMNLMQLVVPMERAQCLYKMRYISASDQPNHCGMHWVAQTHVDSSKNWAEILQAVQGRPTINKRLMFLHQSLRELRASPALTRWLTPQLALWW